MDRMSGKKVRINIIQFQPISLLLNEILVTKISIKFLGVFLLKRDFIFGLILELKKK